jgi:hypothetical protein
MTRLLAALPLALILNSTPVFAHSWSTVAATGAAPSNVGVMLLLPDGTVLAQENDDQHNSSAWYLLTPDSSGHYVDGTWTALSSMHDSRLFFSSQVLPNGTVFVAGGEDGTGNASAEIYNPQADPLNPGHDAIPASDPWTYISPPTSLLNPSDSSPAGGNQAFLDATSELLPNGNVLDAPVNPGTYGGTLIYSPANGWTNGPTLKNNESDQDEASWVKLPDNSILTIGPFDQTSQRFIPTVTGGSGSWIVDHSVPQPIYDSIVSEEGPANLLPNGKAFFSGGTGNTVIYTPSGSTAEGSWTQGPVVPQNLAPQDAPGAMMNNGKLLCAFAPKATANTNAGSYQPPTSFFEYDYTVGTTGSFTEVGAPYGSDGGPNNLKQAPAACYTFEMLDLPDGKVLMSNFGGTLYIYNPDSNTNSTVTSLKPTISSVTRAADGAYLLSGTLLNGFSEGAAYGDDAQMSTNYPIVSLTNGSKAYYARTLNWSSTGVRQTGKTVTTEFFPPLNLPTGTYSLVVSANGLQSAAYSFTYSSPFVWVDFNYTGTGNGSFQSPYNTLAAGISAVASGGTIEIEDGGSSTETPAITKALSIYAYNGAATIGGSTPKAASAQKKAVIETSPTVAPSGPVTSGNNLPLRPHRTTGK